MRREIAALIAAMAMVTTANGGETLRVTSPDGRNELTFTKDGKELRYELKRDGVTAVGPSRAGLHVDNRVWEMALGPTPCGIRSMAKEARLKTVSTAPRCI